MAVGMFVFGMNHRTAPLALRERYALPPEAVPSFLASLVPPASEAVFLSTCNRVEVYLAAEDAAGAFRAFRGALDGVSALSEREARRCLYRWEGAEAVRHLFRVASSLDSLVVGEAQVLGQVKRAYDPPRPPGPTGPVLNRAFQGAFATAKRVRRETEVARLPVSVPSVAVDLAARIFRDLSEHAALLFGAGETGGQAARYLREAGVGRLTVANRSRERARHLASWLSAETCSLAEGLGRLAATDVVVLALARSPGFLKRRAVEEALASRSGRPLFVVDLGVPRNAEDAVGDLPGVYLYRVDDLEDAARANREKRAAAAQVAERLVEEEAAAAAARLEGLRLLPTLVRLRERFEEERRRGLEEFFRRNPGLSPEERERLDRASRTWTNRMLHGPTVRIRKMAEGKGSAEAARLIREMFGLEDES